MLLRKKFALKAWGKHACFTRPEMHVERVSYDIPTPSSVRAIFEAILWKPEIQWDPKRIQVLNQIQWMNVRRNEISDKISISKVNAAMNGNSPPSIDIVEKRQQRASLILHDVSYILTAELVVLPGNKNNPQKYFEMFERRAFKGQCVNQPYFGCREFAANFELMNPTCDQASPACFNGIHDLGWMFYDHDFSYSIPRPQFFHAQMKDGILDVPSKGSKEIRK